MYTQFVRKAITKNMFWMVSTTVHLNENDDTDKFSKVRKFTDLPEMRFHDNWTLFSRISTDESMIKLKGLSNVKQYIPAKTTKWGYKMWLICDSNGYLINLKFYSGKIPIEFCL